MGLGNVRMERALRRNTVLNKIGRALPSLARSFDKRAQLRDCDILALQEVCLADKGQIPYFEKIFRKRNLEPQHYCATEHPTPSGRCQKGLVLMSHHPIREANQLRLPKVGVHRVAVWADISIPGLSGARGPLLRVYNIHLSNRDGRNWRPVKGRHSQLEAVLQHYRKLEALVPGAPVIILGDFNSIGTVVRRQETGINMIKRDFDSALTKFRQTMVLPYMTDWIFYRNLQIRSAGVSHIASSDHFPVVATFALG